MTKIADARRGNSGEMCGKHETQIQNKTYAVRECVQGAEAVLASTRLKLVTGSIRIDVK
jgi:hypothetical protein